MYIGKRPSYCTVHHIVEQFKAAGVAEGIIITHWFIYSDCSQQPHNVGMSELSHDGCFLEECGLLFVS